MVVGSAPRLVLAVIVTLLANACQLQTVAPPLKDRPAKSPRPDDAAPRKASPEPVGSPAASVRPAATGAPSASPAAGLAKLLAPAGASERLEGTVRLDAGYLVAAGAGNVL